MFTNTLKRLARNQSALTLQPFSESFKTHLSYFSTAVIDGHDYSLQAKKRKLLRPICKVISLSTALLCGVSNYSFAIDQVDTKQISPVAIVIHGGAGTILRGDMSPEKEQAYIQTLTAAINKGYAQLLAGNDGTEAVTAAIMHMENSSLFNAGKGAVYTFDGTHELDASIMHGKDKQAGAVAGIQTVKNPILAALLVMQKSDHVMLTGQGAQSFASLHNLDLVENNYFNTQHRFEALQDAKKKIIEKVQKHTIPVSDIIEFQDYKYGTVGAVVLDRNGNLVAGTSTGGMTAKRYGRVGDSPIIGAGTYADNASCAVSATGHGEYFIRYNVAADICARVKYQGVSLQKAANTVMFDVLNKDAGSGGIIAIDNKGNIAMPFNTPGMYRASIDTSGNTTVKIYQD